MKIWSLLSYFDMGNEGMKTSPQVCRENRNVRVDYHIYYIHVSSKRYNKNKIQHYNVLIYI